MKAKYFYLAELSESAHRAPRKTKTIRTDLILCSLPHKLSERHPSAVRMFCCLSCAEDTPNHCFRACLVVCRGRYASMIENCKFILPSSGINGSVDLEAESNGRSFFHRLYTFYTYNFFSTAYIYTLTVCCNLCSSFLISKIKVFPFSWIGIRWRRVPIKATREKRE